MQLRKYWVVDLLVLINIGCQVGHCQILPDSACNGCLAIYPDPIAKVLDSLDLVPAVLPIDLPIEEFRISSPFGIRQHPIHKQKRFHAGVDVKATVGMIVKTTAPGIVSQVGYDPGLGSFIRVQHAFGFETTYGHLSGYCVRAGQVVARSEQIGKVGQSGLVTGPHLHYTIKKNGSVIDPFQFCFLLRRQLWLYKASSVSASGNSGSTPDKSLSSKGSYPNSRN